MRVGFDLQMGRGGRGRLPGIKLSVGKWFFDRDHVIQAVGVGMARVLSRFGYFTMRDARQSIRRPRKKSLGEMSEAERKEYRRRRSLAIYNGDRPPERPYVPSRPGEPPRNRSGLLKDNIFFAYERLRHSVVIGPAKLHGNIRVAGQTVPEILEEGGYAVNRRAGRTVRIEKRPYMEPAFDRQLQKHVHMLKNSVRGR